MTLKSDSRIEELKKLLPRCLLPDWVRLGRRLVRILQDRHHSSRHDALLVRLLDEVHRSIELREQRKQNVPLVTYPTDLPITVRKDEIIQTIRNHQVVVIAGETGSGKTTQLPKMCLDAGLGIEAKIGCTQPRRVAALSISQRIAEELNVEWGQQIGCKIRFDDRSSNRTYIKLMTDGILLAEMQGDPDLSEYNAIIIDEAHERSLNIDFLLGHLKGLLGRRHDLKLIITSATIDTQVFSKHFGDAPVIEVSGRMYPVDVQYRPIDATAEERGDVSYVDAAVSETERILFETNFGDILVFMPGERDIRETADQLEGRFSREVEVIPLFGRLSAGDQQRVFSPSSRRKIVIATNIAETSLTIPGIRHVIDSGLARIGRYNPRTRTKRLPIEPVSQSSANQRKGRAGRVQDGVCIRLYSEEDFLGRPFFTQPEIQRANLAEVILRMKAFHFGAIETFPFVQPPSPAAIQNGYLLLQELGALDEERDLTPLGKDLARLPIDPTLGRMLLQSQHEHATHEMLIISAGLSIQDPRERPLDQKDAAAAAHRKFTDPQSDFLSLLNIWDAVHDEWDRLRTQGQRRKFCRQHFLSYLRMREWQDVYNQLHDALDDLGTLKLNESNASYDAIHRSITAGLIGHIAHFEERNSYKASGNRMVSIFPGSALHSKGEPSKKQHSKAPKAVPIRKSNQPEWIVAGEIVETSQLFARTIAGIDPLWIYKLAPHCCKVTHQNPHWNAKAGNVLVEEIVTLHGLEVQRRKVSYGNILPNEATNIFIRSALVEENLLPSRHRDSRETETDEDSDDVRVLTPNTAAKTDFPEQYRFITHNRAIRQKIENWRTRVRSHDLGDLDLLLSSFYAKHLQNISSILDLNRLLRDSGMQEKLCVSEAELTEGRDLQLNSEAFPDSIIVGGQPVALSYSYAPGEEHDGVTIELPFSVAQSASSALIEWAVPGLRAEMVTELLRALPKSVRKELMPFPPKISEIVNDFQPTGGSFHAELAGFLFRRYGVAVKASDWTTETLPAHLRPRVSIVDNTHKFIGSGRDLSVLQQTFKDRKIDASTKADSKDWLRAANQFERFGITEWNWDDLPEQITVTEGAGLPVYAWPGLEFADGDVNLRLFHSTEAARLHSLPGLRRMVELSILRDLAWLEKELRRLSQFAEAYSPIGDLDELKETALEHLKRHLLPEEPLKTFTRQAFESELATTRERLPGLAIKFIERFAPVLKLLTEIQHRIKLATPSVKTGIKTLSSLSQLGTVAPPAHRPNDFVSTELSHLLPERFLEKVEYERLPHLPRYLKALLIRADRAEQNPAKEKERQQLLAPFLAALNQLVSSPKISLETSRQINTFRWMVEEYKVSLFAQELGTAIPVSAQRLQNQLAGIMIPR
jgi:ATP-dependent helicase HrpA